MGYTIKKIEINNFKFINPSNPLVFEINNNRLVILNGQNGYGKTTFFDALELLFTGTIDHLKDVGNKTTTKENISSTIKNLFNSPDTELEIVGQLTSDNDDVILKRTISLSKSEIKIKWNEKFIEQDELEERLHISNNLYNIGTYISQSKSLSFLENKLKDRRTIITKLTNTQEVDAKLELINQTSDALDQRISKEKEKLNTEIENIDLKIDKLTTEIKNTEEYNSSNSTYKKLFSREYAFDSEVIDTKKSFMSLINPLKDIKIFIEHYIDYKKYTHNKQIENALTISKDTYKRLFFSDIILEINNNLSKIETVSEILKYIDNTSKADMPYIDDNVKKLFSLLDINSSYTNSLQVLINDYNVLLDSSNKVTRMFNEFDETRNIFINKYNDCNHIKEMLPSKCPLCGAEHSNFEKAIADTINELKGLLKINNDNVNVSKGNIHHYFSEYILPKLKEYITINNRIYQNHKELKGILSYDTSELEKILSYHEISMKHTDNTLVYDLSKFEQSYETAINLLKSKLLPIQNPIGEAEFIHYQELHNNFFNNIDPNITKDDIDTKISYIASRYTNGIVKELDDLYIKKREFNFKQKELENSFSKMKTDFKYLKNKYDTTYKNYQTNLARAIRLPVLIYSGKILQNYPLGLGVDTVVKNAQLCFEAFCKKDTDVINILSTGQLNGLSISIILAIKNVYGDNEGLNMLLIDDPLQTIDEISAISLMDLLDNSNIDQIIISTHEDEKTRMISYKFNNLGYKPLEFNMREMYLKLLDNNIKES